MNYSQILKKGEDFLKKSKIKNPNLDTELILSKVINKKSPVEKKIRAKGV